MSDQVNDDSGGNRSTPGARLLSTDGAWWDEFFADRSKAIPFFAGQPDENLAEWFSSGLLGPGRVLELGCGNGRNATYLAGLGCAVDAVDFSAQAIGWARERASRIGVPVTFHHCSIFDAHLAGGSYNLVYDSGCFHHIPPHRREIPRALPPDRRAAPEMRIQLWWITEEGGVTIAVLEWAAPGFLGGRDLWES